MKGLGEAGRQFYEAVEEMQKWGRKGASVGGRDDNNADRCSTGWNGKWNGNEDYYANRNWNDENYDNAGDDEGQEVLALKGKSKGKCGGKSNGKGKRLDGCQWCGKIGHRTRECRHLNDYMRRVWESDKTQGLHLEANGFHRQGGTRDLIRKGRVPITRGEIPKVGQRETMEKAEVSTK